MYRCGLGAWCLRWGARLERQGRWPSCGVWLALAMQAAMALAVTALAAAAVRLALQPEWSQAL